MIYDLILKNIEILKEKNIGFKIKIDNQIYDNHKNGEKLIEIEYRKDKNIEVIFFEELDFNYIISLDKLFKEFCGIEEKREKNIMFKMLSKMQPNIELKKTIKNIENIFIEDLNVKKIDFYFNLDLKILKETNFYLSSKEKIKFSKFLKNEIFLPINLEDGYLGYFKLVRDQSFDLFDVYIIKNLRNMR